MRSPLTPVNDTDVLILGGGLTGLATAYFLQREGVGPSYALLEAGPRWGGKILTEERGGFLVEGGPDSFITRKPWALELVRELGLGDRVRETPAEHGRVFVLCGGRPVELPEGMVFVVPTREEAFLRSSILSEAGKRRVLEEVNVPPRRQSEDESLADFIRRRFGAEALELSLIHI